MRALRDLGVAAVDIDFERADPEASIAETVQNVTKLRGTVTRVPAGSLPNDGKVIEDRRPIG